MSAMLTEVILIVVLLVANGIFAMSELAVMSARKARLQQRAEEGDKGARAALDLASTPDRFLSTVQIGITLIGILAGAFGGATIAEQIALALAAFPSLAPWSEAVGLGIVVLCITFLSLVIGELVPKQIALSHPEDIAAAVARPMAALARLGSPVVHVLSGASRLLLRLLGVRPSTEPAVTEEEVRVLIEQGTEVGTFQEAERKMIDNVLRLGDRRVSAFMTPRTDVVWLDIHSSPETLLRVITETQHSRFPVGEGSIDAVLGVVQARDLLVQSLRGQPMDLTSVMMQPLFVPESTPALKALELLRQHAATLALVFDEYGGFEGLITINDIAASVVGDTAVTRGADDPGVVRREDGSWLVDGMLSIDEFKELVEVDTLPGEEAGAFRTVAGFVLSFLEHIPRPGEHFRWSGLHIEVLDMDGKRIDKVLVARAPAPAGEGPDAEA